MKLSPRRQAAAAKAKAKAKAAKAIKAKQAKTADYVRESSGARWDLGLGLGLIGAGGLAIYSAYKMWGELDESEKPELLASGQKPGTLGPLATMMLPASYFAPATGSFDIVQVFDVATGAWIGSPEAQPTSPAAFDALNSSNPDDYAANYATQAKAQGCESLKTLLAAPAGKPASKFVFRWITKDGTASKYAAMYSNCADGKIVLTAPYDGMVVGRPLFVDDTIRASSVVKNGDWG